MPELSQVVAVGHLASLWAWALTYAPDGDVSDYEAIDIAEGARYSGDPDVFVETLKEVRLLDADGETVRIHNWEQYGGRYMEQRELARQRTAEWRARKRSETSETTEGKSDSDRKQVAL